MNTVTFSHISSISFITILLVICTFRKLCEWRHKIKEMRITNEIPLLTFKVIAISDDTLVTLDDCCCKMSANVLFAILQHCCLLLICQLALYKPGTNLLIFQMFMSNSAYTHFVDLQICCYHSQRQPPFTSKHSLHQFDAVRGCACRKQRGTRFILGTILSACKAFKPTFDASPLLFFLI